MYKSDIPLKQVFRKTFYLGTKHHCPICQSQVRQLKTMPTIKPRPNAICPVCSSLERHRMIWLYFRNKTNLFSPEPKKMLHIAPEGCFVEYLNKLPQLDYLTGDLLNPAMLKVDITDLQFPDNSFDIIYCSHVLEHVPDDRKAMRELSRVLKPSGWAVLQVPIEAEQTFEDLSITDPKERERLFGQFDHVRVYGPDYKDRLEESGFQVTVIDYLNQFDSKDRLRYGLTIEKDDIYLCTLK
jgi:SAM-dependent methyltransferase